MTINRKLLEILVCPITKVPVSLLDGVRLAKLNNLIKSGGVYRVGGDKVEKPFKEALITDTGSAIYPIEDGIPIMLEGESISCHQLEDW